MAIALFVVQKVFFISLFLFSFFFFSFFFALISVLMTLIDIYNYFQTKLKSNIQFWISDKQICALKRNSY